MRTVSPSVGAPLQIRHTSRALPRRYRVACASLCLLLVMVGPVLAGTAAAATPPVLHGTVVDMSVTPHRPAARLPIELQIRRNGQTLSAVKGQTDAHGNFTLAAPPLPKGATYAVVTIYRRVPYGVAVPAADWNRRIQVPVYQTTPADTAIAAMRVIVGVEQVGKVLRVIEEWPFANTGTRTVVGRDLASGREAAGFALPAGATNVSVMSVTPPPATAAVAGDRVLVNDVIRPATGLNTASLHGVTFTFDLPLGHGRPTLLIPTRYFVGSLYVFTVHAHLVAPGFKTSSLPLNGKKLPALELDAIPPGSTLAVGVGGPPAVASRLAGAATPAAQPASAPSFPTGTVSGVVEAGFVLMLLFALRGRLPALASSRDRLELQRERARLVGAIAELDLQRAGGRVPEGEYRRRRSREKGRLLAVARQLGE